MKVEADRLFHPFRPDGTILTARSIYGLIDYCVKVPVLCLDQLGYAVPTKEQADILFQVLISKRTELATTIVTHKPYPITMGGRYLIRVAASAILDRLSMNGRFITFEGKGPTEAGNSRKTDILKALTHLQAHLMSS